MERETNQPSSPRESLSWQAPEYEHVARGTDWYFALWIISGSLSVAAVIFKNILLGILILLGAFAFTLFGHRKPRIVVFGMDYKGIYSGEIFYPYSHLDSFWVEDMPGIQSKLIIKSKKKLVPLISLPIEDVRTDEVRYFLSHFLPEEEQQESLFIKIMEHLGF